MRSILQVRKVRHREVRWPPYIHIVNKWQSREPGKQLGFGTCVLNHDPVLISFPFLHSIESQSWGNENFFLKGADLSFRQLKVDTSLPCVVLFSLDLLLFEQLQASQDSLRMLSHWLQVARLWLQFKSLPRSWMFQKGHSVLQGCFSGVGFDLGKDEPHCRAEAVSLLCLRERLSRTLSAFGVEVPCQKLQLSTLAVWPTYLLPFQ